MPQMSTSKLPGAPLLFPLEIKVWIPQNGNWFIIMDQRHGTNIHQPLLVLLSERQDNGHGLIVPGHAILVQNAVEMKRLQVFLFAHESFERAGPAF